MLWLQRLFFRTCALVRRCIDREIIESDLAQGIYELVSTTEKQTVRGHVPYARKSIVKLDEKWSWTVLSEKPFASRFSVIADGLTNKVVR